jgi:hypothetical protein
MAQRTVVQLTDDFDGTEAVETISFAFEGTEYEIDLSEENAAHFRAAIGEYANVARAVGGRSRRGRSARSARKRDIRAVRAWAQENGYAVSARGRISRDVMEAYQAAR